MSNNLLSFNANVSLRNLAILYRLNLDVDLLKKLLYNYLSKT